MSGKKRNNESRGLKLKAKRTIEKINKLLEDENIEKFNKILQLAKELFGILITLYGLLKSAQVPTKKSHAKTKGIKSSTRKLTIKK